MNNRKGKTGIRASILFLMPAFLFLFSNFLHAGSKEKNNPSLVRSIEAQAFTDRIDFESSPKKDNNKSSLFDDDYCRIQGRDPGSQKPASQIALFNKVQMDSRLFCQGTTFHILAQEYIIIPSSSYLSRQLLC